MGYLAVSLLLRGSLVALSRMFGCVLVVSRHIFARILVISGCTLDCTVIVSGRTAARFPVASGGDFFCIMAVPGRTIVLI